MTNRNRIAYYMVGFLVGTCLVSVIMMRRNAREQAAVDPWAVQQQAALALGYEPLPKTVPEVMAQGTVINYGVLPSEAAPEERVWLLNFTESYPYVRVVEQIESGALSFMAADQVLLELADGVDVTALKPMLDELGLRMRMFNRKERVAVIGVLSTQIDAVPATLEAIQPWASLFVNAEPDYIKFR
ncbi:hypothetical protein [Coraliomargarita parva]|uniref:hypothetical protein n=1 Tax=Coraliomargarita parva TaxID=3014050 RepID=UPI0022B40D1E|nr:hypothetical protein [Coraliomargarita parva]